MSRQKEYTKSDLSFNDLLRAGLGVPLKDKPAPEKPDADEQPDRVAEEPGKLERKRKDSVRVRSGKR